MMSIRKVIFQPRPHICEKKITTDVPFGPLDGEKVSNLIFNLKNL